MIKLGLRDKAFERIAGTMRKSSEYLADGTPISLSDNKITAPDPEYKYYPLKGYGSQVAVSDASGQFIGWAAIEDISEFDTVKDWMSSEPEQMRLELPQEAWDNADRDLGLS
jgi:hypothetical protein